MIAKKLRWLLKPTADVTGDTSPRRRVRSRATATPADNPTVHPWHELTSSEGRIMQSGTGKPTEYLATPEIQIVGKKEALVDIEGGRASYAFKLNAAPDVFWRHRFAKNIEDLPDGINRSDVRVEFDGDTLLLLCMPSRLEAKYRWVKANVAKTNADYQCERQRILERLQREADEKGQGTAKVDIIKRRFERLKL